MALVHDDVAVVGDEIFDISFALQTLDHGNINHAGWLDLSSSKGPLPSTVRVVVSNLVYIEKKDLPSAMLDRLIRIAAFQNPEFYRAQAMRLSTYGKPRVISCSEDFLEHIGLPRACVDEVLAVFKFHGVNVELQDERTMGREIRASFNAELRPEQKEAINQVLLYDQGILSAPTAFGKTVVSAHLIARRAVNALILVHRRQLMDQWRERLAAFLDMPIGSIGQFVRLSAFEMGSTAREPRPFLLRES